VREEAMILGMPLLVVSCGILLDYRGGEGEGRRGKMKVEKVRQEERQRRGATHHTLPLPAILYLVSPKLHGSS